MENVKRVFRQFVKESDHDGETTSGNIPSVATEGVAVPNGPDYNCQLLVKMGAAAEPLACHLEIWGYCSATSAWYFLEDLETINGEVGETTFRFAKLIQGATAFSRLHARFVDIPKGTTPDYDVDFLFS